VANATSYTWSTNVAGAVVTPNGTSASISFPSFTTGTVSVTANNACGSSAVRILSVKGTPATPASITGSTSVCANQAGVPYSISPVATATSYTWTGMAGSHISDGVTTSTGTVLTTTSTSVTVNFGSTAGNLNVKANNACGAGANKSLAIAFVCKSIEETNNISSLELYPNPAKEFVDVNFQSSLAVDGMLVISDVMGREVYKMTIHSNEHEYNSSIDLRGISKGVYFLTINQSGQKITKKLILD
jgi:hypothetical protein